MTNKAQHNIKEITSKVHLFLVISGTISKIDMYVYFLTINVKQLPLFMELLARCLYSLMLGMSRRIKNRTGGSMGSIHLCTYHAQS